MAWVPVHGHGPHTHGAHVHGVATLDMAAEGGRLELHLLSPLESLVGFERYAFRCQQLRWILAVLAAGFFASLIPALRACKLSLADGLTPRL
jgi:hypothetical protein